MRAALVVIVVVATSAPLAAAPVGIVVVASDSAPVAPGRVRQAMDAAVRAAGGDVEARPLALAAARVEAGAVPVARRAALERAAEQVRGGWSAYLAAELEDARGLLEQARAAAEGVLDLAGGVELLADVSLRMGAVLVQLGRADEAASALALARALDVGRPVTIDEFAPEVVQAYEAAAVPAAVDAVVDIVVAPPGARVAVDGRDAGVAPVRASVSAGAHAIVARAPGHHGRAVIVDVGARPEVQRIDLVLEPDPVARAVLRGREPVPADAADVSVLVEGILVYAEPGALVLVASAWRGGAPALLGQRCAGVPVRCTAVVEVRYPAGGDDAAAAELWASLARGELLVRGPELAADGRLAEARPRPSAPPAPSCRWCRSPWPWIGVGVVAAGAAVWLAQSRASRPVVILDPCDFGGCQ